MSELLPGDGTVSDRSVQRNASCHCGRLSLCCSGEPAKVSLCNCLDCQRRTGSLFSVAVFFTRDQVEGMEGFSSFTRPLASGNDVTFHFCPSCGTNLWWEPARMPHLIGVAAECFADPHFPKPEQAVWCDYQHGWLNLSDAMPTHAKNPPPRPAPPLAD